MFKMMLLFVGAVLAFTMWHMNGQWFWLALVGYAAVLMVQRVIKMSQNPLIRL